MKFFNIDLHISVIADISQILENLGHSVDINYLSNHAWVFGKSPNNSFCINQNNWMKIDKNMCDEFYNQNKDRLADYDGFIVTHIPALSLLYEKFDKPIIFVASTRYEYPFTNDANRWKWFNEYINKNKNIIPIANNLYDKWYCEQFLDIEFEYIPSLCEYTNSKHNFKKNLSLLYSRKINISDSEIVNKESIGRYTWDNISEYKSIIHIPYNVSTMSILEQYTSNIPMFFPSKNLLFELTKKKLTLTEASYTQVFGLINKSVVDYKDVDPNDTNSDSIIHKLIELSDFYNDNMKYVSYFDDPQDLKNKINNLDSKDISEKMRKHNEIRKETVYNSWKKIIEKI